MPLFAVTRLRTQRTNEGAIDELIDCDVTLSCSGMCPAQQFASFEGRNLSASIVPLLNSTVPIKTTFGSAAE